jgi:exodeoxyribonuclease VII large subunit
MRQACLHFHYDPRMNRNLPSQTGAVYTVSQLNRLAKGLLEDHFPAVLVEGEISNFACPSSGHWYLTLKDSGAQLRCAMFRNRNMFVRMKPRDGMRVLVKGRLSLYEGRGDYQLLLDQMEETGAGALRQAFEQLQARLQAEGLFDAVRKRPLPALPRHLAVITSPTGAAIHDVLSVLKRRFPGLPVTVVPVAVQGQQAAGEIIAALQLVNLRQGCLADVDLILLTRGGGSLEDLWSFNDENLARTIHASVLPVVAAIGHEVDFTIAEFVADVRAPTPSAAAELLSPHQDAWRQRLARVAAQLAFLLKQRIAGLRQQVLRAGKRLQHPGRRLQEQAQRLDELESRLRRGLSNLLQHKGSRLRLLRQRVATHAPDRQLALLRQRLGTSRHQLLRAWRNRLQQLQIRLQAQAHALHTVSPLATLGRGYSITTTARGSILSSYEQVGSGATIRTRLARGSIESIVQSVAPEAEPDKGKAN